MPDFFLEKTNLAKKKNAGSTSPHLEPCSLDLSMETAAGVLSRGNSGPAAGGCNPSPSSDENTSLLPPHNPGVLWIMSSEKEKTLSMAPGRDRVTRSAVSSLRLYFRFLFCAVKRTNQTLCLKKNHHFKQVEKSHLNPSGREIYRAVSTNSSALHLKELAIRKNLLIQPENS